MFLHKQNITVKIHILLLFFLRCFGGNEVSQFSRIGTTTNASISHIIIIIIIHHPSSITRIEKLPITSLTMKNSIISLVISWLLAGSTPVSADAILDGPMKDLKTLFREWQVEFGKEYSTAKELATRMEIWVENHCTCILYICYHVIVVCIYASKYVGVLERISCLGLKSFSHAHVPSITLQTLTLSLF